MPGGDLRGNGKKIRSFWNFSDSGLCPKNLKYHCKVFKHRSDKTSILKTLQLAVVQRMDEKGHGGATGR